MGIDARPVLIKLKLHDLRTVDFTVDVIKTICRWRQTDSRSYEAGGYLTGYINKKTTNITVDGISEPCRLDRRSRFRIDLKDPEHKSFLYRQAHINSYYTGLWHTHPEPVPNPSDIDWRDWRETLRDDKSATDYIFFVIAGIEKIRVWCGVSGGEEISELFEVEKMDGIYLT